MKPASLLLFAALFTACTTEPAQEQQIPIAADTMPTETPAPIVDTATAKKTAAMPEVHANQRFRNVRVEKTGEHQYRITGQAQVFEASFSWVIEDGHNELQKGHQMTDAGAPAWGNFDFTVTANKARENSTLHLILFEISANDGSRQYELPIKLE